MLFINLVVSLIALVIGCLGNIGIVVTSLFTKTFGSLFIVNVALFDALSILFGPGMFLVTYLKGTTWLRENPEMCKALGFMKNFTTLGSLFSWMFLTVYCRQIHVFSPKPTLFRLLLMISWVLALGVSSLGFSFGAYSYQDQLKVCFHSTTNSQESISQGYSYFVISLSIALHLAAMVISSLNLSFLKTYHMKLQWQRHTFELQLNDPEHTTVQSSQSDFNAVASSLESLLATLAKSKTLGITVPEAAKDLPKNPTAFVFMDASNTGSQNAQGRRPIKQEVEDHIQTVNVPETLSTARETSQGKCYTIPLVNDTKKQAKFKSTVSLAEYNAKQDRDNRQFLIMVVIATCLSLIGWIPKFVTIVLLMTNTEMTDSVLLAVDWLIYLKALFSPALYLVCCKCYREIFRYVLRKLKNCFCVCDTSSQNKSRGITFNDNVNMQSSASIKELVELQYFSQV